MAETRAQKNRAIRKEEMRAYLAERGRVDYVLDNIENCLLYTSDAADE